MTDNQYKIELGIGLQKDDFNKIKNDIKSLEDKPIRLEIDAETKELTKTIQDALKALSKGGQNAFTIDTSEFTKSIDGIKTAVVDLQKTLGSLGDNVNMKDLLTSVNQIANAIGKVTDESETLAKSLSILSKKEFGFNFNLKTGNANPIKAATDYGVEARRKAIPAMKEQVAYLQELLGGTEKADKALERYLIKQNKGFGGVTEKNNLQRVMLGGTDLDGKTISYNKQMGAYEQTIDYLKKIAIESGRSLDGFDAKFSKTAENIVDDTIKIQTGAKQTEEALEEVGKEMKQIFGGGVSAEGLSASLEPIVADLNQIREAVVNLSKGVSLEGLTSSFDRLSASIENLLANAERVKGVLNSNLSNSTIGRASTVDATPIKSAQQIGQKIGEAITKAAQQSINLDDVIDKETRALMKEYGIKGNKNSDAFKDIRQSIVNYRNELKSGGLSDIGDGFGSYSNVNGIRQVTSALAANKTEAIELDTAYDELLKDLKSINTSGQKVNLVDEIKEEWGDDYSRNRSALGAAFATGHAGDGIDLSDWISDKSWSHLIDLNQSAQGIADDLLNAVKQAKNRTISGDELFSTGHLKIDDVEASVVSALGNIEKAEQQMAQSSTQSANTVTQNENQKQQEYEETKRKLDEIDKVIADNQRRFDEVSANGGDAEELQKYLTAIDELEEKKAKLLTSADDLNVNSGLENVENGFKEIDVEVEEAENQVGSLREALKSLGLNDSSVENIISDFEKLGVTVKRVTSRLNSDDSMKLTVKGVNTVGDTVTSTATIAPDSNEAANWSNTVTREVNEAEQSLNRLKTITKEINSLKIDAFKFNDKGNIEQAKVQMEALEKEASELRAELQKKFPTTSLDEIDDIARRGQQALEQLKAEAAHKIKIDIASEKFENQVNQLRNGLNRLSDENGQLKALRIAIEQVKDAKNKMLDAANDDELIEAQKLYAAVIAKANNELKIQTRLQSADNANKRLKASIDSLEHDMLNWLKENSKATKEYKGQIDDLIASLHRLAKADNPDQALFNGYSDTFTNIKKDAKYKGLTGLNFLDSMKSKIKEYSVYFGAAEMFMYAEQGLRDMFEQVKLIDSAMTELKKVTNETDAAYDKFLTNAADRAKAIGTTIDGLVSSTADFARLGYGFEDAQGLAEVANIYAVVGDEIDGVEGATESLISTMAAFKSEMNGMSNSDFAMSIIDKFNEIGNNFAISSGGIGEALERSASSLMAANNTIDESIALITAANTVVQDPEAVGTAFKTKN